MEEKFEQAMQLIDNCTAVIQELTAQLQSKSQEDTMAKKAEHLASKLNISFADASAIIKTASEDGTNSEESIIKIASALNRNPAFGRVFVEETTFAKTDSAAQDKYLEKEAALMSELGLN